MQPELLHVELWILCIAAALILGRGGWVWLSPASLAQNCWPLHTCHLPRWIQEYGRVLGVRFYLVPELGRDYACATYVGFERVILVASHFFQFSPTQVIEFVLAHELGHHRYGHPWRRMLIVGLYLDRLQAFADYLAHTEDQATRFAENMTKLPRSIVWGLSVVSAPGGTGQSTEERNA